MLLEPRGSAVDIQGATVESTVSPLRWAGSKLQIVPQLREFWSPTYDRYVEPFAGSAALFFSLAPSNALLADTNAELISTYKEIQTRSSRVLECLLRFPRTRKGYYAVRAMHPSMLPPSERAARFLFLNAHCFNGLYRTNEKGLFNVPYGSKHRQVPYSSEHLQRAATLLRRATLFCGDFEETLDRTREGDFVYLDPPYALEDRRSFVEYGDSPFCPFDLPRLFDRLHEVDKRGIAFVVSYADSPEVRKLGRPWSVQIVQTRRNIAGFGGSRKFAQELLIYNRH
jgi:DNA adenine methylase